VLRLLAALPAFLLLVSSDLRADYVVTSLDAGPQRGISLGLAGGKLTLTTSTGTAIRSEAARVIEITVLPARTAPPERLWPFEVELRDGTRLRGELAPGRTQELRIRCPSLKEEQELSLDDVMTIKRVSGAKIPGSARLVRIPEKDAAYTLVGTRYEGTIAEFNGTGIRIKRERGLKEKSIPYGKLAAIFIENDPHEHQPGLQLVARMTDGSSLRLTKDFRISAGELSGTTALGLRLRAPLDRIAAIGFRGGSFEYVSDLTPVDTLRKPFFPVPDGAARDVYLDFVAPIRIDRSPDGRPITLFRHTYPKGIGVRPRTELTYALEGAFREFRVLCGIDDEVLGPGYGKAGGLGSVVFVVEVDGKVRYVSKPMRGRMKPASVKVDVTGAKRLKLIVTRVPKAQMPKNAEDSSELDNAVWAQPLLVR